MVDVERGSSVEFPVLEKYSRMVFSKSSNERQNFLRNNLWRQAIIQVSKKFFDGENRFLESLLLQGPLGKVSMAYNDGEGRKIREIKDVGSMDEIYLGKKSDVPLLKEYFRVSKDDLENYDGSIAIARIKSGPDEVYGKGILEKDGQGIFRLNYAVNGQPTKKVLGKKSLDNVLIEDFFRS